jgi:MFS-type transporter involved in bile tolerance (Atg22 family)
MAASSLLGTDDVGTACISQSLAFIVCTSVFGLAWKFFISPRPALSHVPSDSTLLKSGFQKLFNTFGSISSKWYALRYFLLSIMLSEAATAALSTISTTYMTQVLAMDSKQIGLAFLCVFVAGIPGSKMGNYVGNKLNPLRSAKLCLVVFAINTTLAAALLKGPDHVEYMYIFASVWGICLGWLHPTHSALYCTIIPRGSESEMMGLYLFSGSVLSFLPPLVFTFLNEIGMSMAIGLASLNLFFAGGFIFFVLIGSYNDAVHFALVSQSEEEVLQALPEIMYIN